MKQAVVLLGAPGSGKGTQVRLLQKQRPGYSYVGMGDLFRNEIASQSPLGLEIQEVIKAGNLVDSRIVLQVLTGYLSSNMPQFVIFDGIPRNLEQAVQLDELLHYFDYGLRCVLYLELGEDKILERVLHRLTCASCNTTYRLSDFAVQDLANNAVCTTCGDKVTTRSDDNAAVLAARLRVHNNNITAVVDHYTSRGLLHKVNGDAPPEHICSEIAGYL